MKYVINMLRMLFLTICGFAVNAVSIAQCVTPVITSIGNSGPVCEGGTITLTAAGTIGGVASSFIKMAGIGANDGYRAFNQVFSSGDRAGSVDRITTTTFNTYAAGGAAALRARYDVLLFTWNSPSNLNVNWTLIDAYLALGGSVFWEDNINVGKLAPVVSAVQYEGSYGCSYILAGPAPYPVLVANGVNGCFINHHERALSWPSWMDVYIKGPGGENFAIAGIYPTGGRGRFILQGPDQDYHANRTGNSTERNQYKFILNQLDFLTAEQAGFSWTGPNGFTSNEASPTITGVTAANAGVYTATLTNLTGGGCFTTATTTVAVNTAPTLSCADVNASTDAGVCNAVVTYSPDVAGATSTSYTFTGATTGSGSGTGSGETFNKGVTNVTLTATNDCGSATCTFTVTVTDNEAPVFVGVTLPCPSDITAISNACGANVSWTPPGPTDNCGVSTLTSTHSPGDFFPLGTTVVNYTATDAGGNSSICTFNVTVVGENPQCSITAVPTNNTYTGGVPTNIYLGYGPQSVNLNVNPTGGTSFSYSWSPTAGLSDPTSSAPLFTATTAGTYTFTVLVTNNFGCTTECSITICVLDVRVPGTDGKRIYVCHIPTGNTGNTQTLSLSINAVPTHIFVPGHGGDHLGTCDQTPCGSDDVARVSSNNQTGLVALEGTPFKVLAFPNPSSGFFSIIVQSKEATPIEVRVTDLYGRIVFRQNNVSPNARLQIGQKFPSGSYMIEALQGSSRQNLKLIKAN